jgi:hypothetical protein
MNWLVNFWKVSVCSGSTGRVISGRSGDKGTTSYVPFAAQGLVELSEYFFMSQEIAIVTVCGLRLFITRLSVAHIMFANWWRWELQDNRNAQKPPEIPEYIAVAFDACRTWFGLSRG